MKRDPRNRKVAKVLGTTLAVGGLVGGFAAADGASAMRGLVLASLADGSVMAAAPERAAGPLVRAMGMEVERNTGGTR